MASNAAGLKLAEATTSSTPTSFGASRRSSKSARRWRPRTNQKSALHQVLGVLERHHSVVRSTVALLELRGGEIEVVASEGPPGGKADAKFRLGEGITGRVVAERQADRRSARLARADVPAAHVRAPRARTRGNQLRVRADSCSTAKPSARSAPISASNPIAISIAR